MFKELFNIGSNNEPVLVQEGAVISTPRIQKSKNIPSPPVKIDAEKALQTLLDDLQNVNNPKVDALRMFAVALENGGDLSNLKAFCKQPISKKKK